MQKLDFAEAVELITKQDRRFDREAYFFLRDALDFTVRQRRKPRESDPALHGSGHVSGQQLLEGIRQYALKQFGPMVVTVLEYWNVQSCEDFGAMVYGLIRVGIFGKTDADSIEDFKGGYTFEDAFVAPFLPERPMQVTNRLLISPPQPAKGLS